MAKKVLMQLSRADPKFLQKQRSYPNRAKAILVTKDHWGNRAYYPIPTIEDECRVFLMLLHEYYDSENRGIDEYIKEWEGYVAKPVPTPISEETLDRLPESVRKTVKETSESEVEAYKTNVQELGFFRRVKEALIDEDAMRARALLLNRGSQDSEEFEIVHMEDVPKDYKVT